MKLSLFLFVLVVITGIVWWATTHRQDSGDAPVTQTQHVQPSKSEDPESMTKAILEKQDPALAGNQPAATEDSVPSAVPELDHGSSIKSTNVLSVQPYWKVSALAQHIARGEGEFKQRLAAIAALPPSLNKEEKGLLLKSLQQPLTGLANEAERATLKNNLLDKLLEQFELPDDMGPVLLAQFADKSQEPLWRDYVLQHFSTYLEKRFEQSDKGQGFTLERPQFKRAYEQGLSEHGTGLPGTALIGMRLLVGRFAEYDKAGVATAARRVFRTEGNGEVDQMSAIQTLILLGEKEDVLLDAGLINDPKMGFALRMSFVAGMGALGGGPELQFLKEQSTKETDGRVQVAITSAIAKLEARGVRI